jgi:hypothetical protein
MRRSEKSSPVADSEIKNHCLVLRLFLQARSRVAGQPLASFHTLFKSRPDKVDRWDDFWLRMSVSAHVASPASRA